MTTKVESVSTGVISSDSLPYQSFAVFVSGCSSSWPQAYCLYPFHACSSSCLARSARAGSEGTGACADTKTVLMRTREPISQALRIQPPRLHTTLLQRLGRSEAISTRDARTPAGSRAAVTAMIRKQSYAAKLI